MDGNTEDLQKFVPQVHFEQIKIYVQIKIINVIFPSNTFSVLQLILIFIR